MSRSLASWRGLRLEWLLFASISLRVKSLVDAPVLRTRLLKGAWVGESELLVSSTQGFQAGQILEIGGAETKKIVSIADPHIFVHSPLDHDYPEQTIVEKVSMHDFMFATTSTTTMAYGLCPDSSYEELPIVFTCSYGNTGTISKRYVLHLNAGPQLVGGLPRGLRNFSISVRSKANVNVSIRNPSKGTAVVSRMDGVVHDSQLSSQYEGTNISYSGSSSVPEQLNITGAIRYPLSLFLEGVGNSGYVTVDIDYGYSEIAVCDNPPIGCLPYEADRARDALVAWSAWMQNTFKEFSRLWLHLDLHIWHGLTPAAGVTREVWPEIWSVWPDADKQEVSVNALWKYVSRYGNITADVLSVVFSLSSAQDATWECFNKLRSRSVWERAIEGHTIDYFRNLDFKRDKDEEFDACFPGLWRKRADMVYYLDLDGSRQVEQPEYEKAYLATLKCPEDQYRSSSIVYACATTSMPVYHVIKPMEMSWVAHIPRGVVDLRIDIVTRNGDVDAVLRDEEGPSHEWIGHQYGALGQAGTPQMLASLPVVHHNTRISFHKTSHTSFFESSLHFNATEFESSLWLVPSSKILDYAVVHYSYSGLQKCHTMTDGCGHYNIEVARDAVYHISMWLNSRYATASIAWETLGGNYSEDRGFPIEYWRVIFEMQTIRNSSSVGDLHEPSSRMWMSFFYLDMDSNRFLSKVEWEYAFDHVRTYDATEHFFDVLYDEFEPYDGESGAWSSLANGNVGISPDSWRHLWHMRMGAAGVFCNDEMCGAESTVKVSVPLWSQFDTVVISKIVKSGTEETVHIVEPTGLTSDRFKIGVLNELGLPGKSFTLVARCYRGSYEAHTDDSHTQANHTSQVQSFDGDSTAKGVNSSSNWIFSSPGLSSANKSKNQGLFFGISDGHLTAGFGSEFCTGTSQLPFGKWNDVACVFNQDSLEMSLFVDNELLQVCSFSQGLQDSDNALWAGAADGDHLWWVGKLGGLIVFREALSNLQISRLFGCAPRFALVKVRTFDGIGGGATPIGRASDVRIQNNSWTILADLYVDARQQKNQSHVIVSSANISVGTYEDKLYMQVGKQVCLSKTSLPFAVWVRIAFVFDAVRMEAKLFQDGSFVQVCEDIAASGDDSLVWLGTSGSNQTQILGMLKNVYIFPTAKCTPAINAIFTSLAVVQQLPTQGAFQYLDKNHDQIISEDEFRYCYPKSSTDRGFCFPAVELVESRYDKIIGDKIPTAISMMPRASNVDARHAEVYYSWIFALLVAIPLGGFGGLCIRKGFLLVTVPRHNLVAEHCADARAVRFQLQEDDFEESISVPPMGIDFQSDKALLPAGNPFALELHE